jgi:uncharacterized protein (TIGR02001 family)
MRILRGSLASTLALLAATPAIADDTDPPPPVTVNATATITSDYRFRGISQTDKNAAIQGSITVSHESGLYASVWGSSISSYVTATANSTQEIDLILGWKKTFGGTTVDVGLLYYFYPKTGPGITNFAEPYLAVTQVIGPVSAKALIAYAPKQGALALDQRSTSRLSPARENVYLALDLSASIPNTPIGLTAHIGQSEGPSWLSTTGRGNRYTDWSLGITATWKALTFGVSYVDTNTNFITPSGKDAAKGGIVASLTASF